MRYLTYCLQRIVFAGVLVGSVVSTGCAVHARYYDRVHSDYHTWGPGERDPYARWETEQHRRHIEYNKLRKEDRQAYWNWRHDHP